MIKDSGFTITAAAPTTISLTLSASSERWADLLQALESQKRSLRQQAVLAGFSAELRRSMGLPDKPPAERPPKAAPTPYAAREEEA